MTLNWIIHSIQQHSTSFLRSHHLHVCMPLWYLTYYSYLTCLWPYLTTQLLQHCSWHCSHTQLLTSYWVLVHVLNILTYAACAHKSTSSHIYVAHAHLQVHAYPASSCMQHARSLNFMHAWHLVICSACSQCQHQDTNSSQGSNSSKCTKITQFGH